MAVWNYFVLAAMLPEKKKFNVLCHTLTRI